MSDIVRVSVLVTATLLFGCQTAEQHMSDAQKGAIEETVQSLFEQNIAASEKADLDSLVTSVRDTHNAGFITNGVFYPSFDSLIADVRPGFSRLKGQEITLSDKRITALSPNVVLVTAHGNFAAADKANNTFEGDFAWTFVYAKTGDEWKVIHSHQSSPR